MGKCGEFAISIQEGCSHPMKVGSGDHCICSRCGVVCRGKFSGCAEVWARGPGSVRQSSVDAAERSSSRQGGNGAAISPQANSERELGDSRSMTPAIMEGLASVHQQLTRLGAIAARQETMLTELIRVIHAQVEPRGGDQAILEATVRRALAGALDVSGVTNPINQRLEEIRHTVEVLNGAIGRQTDDDARQADDAARPQVTSHDPAETVTPTPPTPQYFIRPDR